MLDTIATYLQYASEGLTAIIAALAIIAPLTNSDMDNKVLDALRYAEDKIINLILPAIGKKVAAAVPAPADPAK